MLPEGLRVLEYLSGDNLMFYLKRFTNKLPKVLNEIGIRSSSNQAIKMTAWYNGEPIQKLTEADVRMFQKICKHQNCNVEELFEYREEYR